MDEMIKAVAAKAGISTDQAKAAVETVVGMLKDKLPEPAKSLLAGVVGGNATGDVAQAAKDVLGGIKPKLPF